jgi:hypothetical protein
VTKDVDAAGLRVVVLLCIAGTWPWCTGRCLDVR